MGLPNGGDTLPSRDKGSPCPPFPWVHEATVLGERGWLPLTIVPQFGWCFGELDWLL